MLIKVALAKKYSQTARRHKIYRVKAIPISDFFFNNLLDRVHLNTSCTKKQDNITDPQAHYYDSSFKMNKFYIFLSL